MPKLSKENKTFQCPSVDSAQLHAANADADQMLVRQHLLQNELLDAACETVTMLTNEESGCCCYCHETGGGVAVTNSALNKPQSYSNTATLRSTASSNVSACTCASTLSSCLAGSEHYSNAVTANEDYEKPAATAASAKVSSHAHAGNAANDEVDEDDDEYATRLPLQACNAAEKNEDDILPYSFKGFPPELYSPKKEFIYSRPLVQEQVGQHFS